MIDLRPPRRRSLLLAVYGASLLLVAATAGSLIWAVSDNVTATAIDSSVSSDRSLVRAFVATTLRREDVLGSPSPARVAEVGRDLAALIDPANQGILQIKVHGHDGVVVLSDDPGVVGTPGDGDEISGPDAASKSIAEVGVVGDGDSGTLHVPVGTPLLQVYLPVIYDGQVAALFEVYRDAAPILAHVEQTRRVILSVAVVAGLALAVMLHLIFRATQRRLDRQTLDIVESTRRDAVTGLLNHGSSVGQLVDMLATARRTAEPTGVALIDIDNFRALNSNHGHDGGDRALRAVAGILRQELSAETVVGRFGPDDFIVVAPASCVADLELGVERLRARLSDVGLDFDGTERIPLSVSAGICYAPTNGDAAAELLSVATAALNEAKGSGGDGVRVARTNADELRTSERTTFGVLRALVLAVDTKDRYTKRHSEDVARYAVFLADHLDVDADLRATLEVAGLLHDVGKIGIPDSILRKPAALTSDEYDIVKQHVALGDLIVRDLPDIETVRAGIRHHHERWDGAGYLTGLAGTDIPLVARILAVADAFSAMTSSRPYRKAMSMSEAIRRLEDAAGSQLDESLVKVFVAALASAADPTLAGDGRATRIRTPKSIVA
ncbi:MAG TPA: diguanylate cyclase [Candidatus Limnocylindrales bacterium]